MRQDWFGLFKILHIEHVDVGGSLLWEQDNLYNTFHDDGQQFCLRALFAGGNNPNTYIPDNYYIGLDARSTISVSDTMTSLAGEPSGNGYLRQTLNSTSGWTVNLVSGVWQAISGIVVFNSSGSSWGPVTNLFFTNKSDNTGYLIGSTSLANSITLTPGQFINLRTAFALKDC